MTAQVPARRTERGLGQPRDGWRSLREQDVPQGVRFAGTITKQGDAK